MEYEAYTPDDLLYECRRRFKIARASADPEEQKRWVDVIGLLNPVAREWPPKGEWHREAIVAALLLDDDNHDIVGSPMSQIPGINDLGGKFYSRSTAHVLQALRYLEDKIAKNETPYSKETRLLRFRLSRILSERGVAPHWRRLQTIRGYTPTKRDREIKADGRLIDLEWLSARKRHTWLSETDLDVFRGRKMRKFLDEPFTVRAAEEVADLGWFKKGRTGASGAKTWAIQGHLVWEIHSLHIAPADRIRVRKLSEKEEKARERIKRNARSIAQIGDKEISQRVVWWRAGHISGWTPTATARAFRLMTGKEQSRQAAATRLRVLRKIDGRWRSRK